MLFGCGRTERDDSATVNPLISDVRFGGGTESAFPVFSFTFSFFLLVFFFFFLISTSLKPMFPCLFSSLCICN